MQKQLNEKIGQYVQRVMVSSELKNPEILKLVATQFPEAKTTMACIAWYRSDLKKKPVAKVETLESINEEITLAEEKLEELKMKREEFIEKNKVTIEERKAKLLAELEALQAV